VALSRQVDGSLLLAGPARGTRYDVPPLPPWYTSRPRLVARLQSARAPLVLISGPPGAGKSSLAAEWLRDGGPGTVAWLALHGGAPVWPDVVACLDRLGVAGPGSALAHLEPLDPDPLHRRPRARRAPSVTWDDPPLTVVLDDYQVASVEDSRSLAALLGQSIARLRIVLITRVEPVLPLYRYRMDESLAEVGTADLAFSDVEAEQLLRRTGAVLGIEAVRRLNAQLRGWGCGLRLAARDLAARDDADTAVDRVVAASGDLAAYLIGELLQPQLPDVRAMLLRTSIADTLHPELADALVERPSRSTLGVLLAHNAFLEPVPGRLGCFRYQPVVRDLLRAQLRYESPDLVPVLHRVAASWHARQGPGAPGGARAPKPGALVERLTGRELEVLDHLAALLSTDEIAETMYVSKNTVRTHIRSILRKLGVQRRNLAVRRARELGLLGEPS
jgi:LuxR family maltose regulon positive regulatory protein